MALKRSKSSKFKAVTRRVKGTSKRKGYTTTVYVKKASAKRK